MEAEVKLDIDYLKTIVTEYVSKQTGGKVTNFEFDLGTSINDSHPSAQPEAYLKGAILTVVLNNKHQNIFLNHPVGAR